MNSLDVTVTSKRFPFSRREIASLPVSSDEFNSRWCWWNLIMSFLALPSHWILDYINASIPVKTKAWVQCALLFVLETISKAFLEGIQTRNALGGAQNETLEDCVHLLL